MNPNSHTAALTPVQLADEIERQMKGRKGNEFVQLLAMNWRVIVGILRQQSGGPADEGFELPNPIWMARFFHETYERLAPQYGYETRADTKAFDWESPNGRLMAAVCEEFRKTVGAVPEAGNRSDK